GSFAVISHTTVGKMSENLPLFNGHSGAVLDTDFNQFNDHVIASASEDTKAMVWIIPEGGLVESIDKPVLTLAGHGRKVGHVLFHPTADNVLATASADFTVKIWDISTGNEKITLTGHTEIIQSLSWNYDGSLLTTTCKDKKLRVFDVRSNTIVQEAPGHQGIKGSRVVWFGNSDKICTTGFSRSSDHTASGMLIPHYDADTSVLYLAGKGDGNIRYYEWVDEDTSLYYLSEYKSSDPQRGLGFLPKRACNIAECEVARIFKVHPTFVEPISFKVPRKAGKLKKKQIKINLLFSLKSDAFQGDLFPDTIGPEPAMSSDEFFAGKTLPPKLISLEHGFSASASTKEFVTSAVEPMKLNVKVPVSDKEFHDAYHSLRKENDDLKHQVASRDIRIRLLEAQLESFRRE
ncbi:Coronin-2B, partial [Nowakowskiella sp. JEL0078]